MVIALEPAVYESDFGIRLEQVVVVEKTVPVSSRDIRWPYRARKLSVTEVDSNGGKTNVRSPYHGGDVGRLVGRQVRDDGDFIRGFVDAP